MVCMHFFGFRIFSGDVYILVYMSVINAEAHHAACTLSDGKHDEYHSDR